MSTCPSSCTTGCATFDSSYIPTTCADSNNPMACFNNAVTTLKAQPSCTLQCLNGTCKQCASATDCPINSTCTSGKCVSFACTSNADCPDGQCTNGTCVAKSCGLGSSCPIGMECYKGTCQPATMSWVTLLVGVLLIAIIVVVVIVYIKTHGPHSAASSAR